MVILNAIRSESRLVRLDTSRGSLPFRLSSYVVDQEPLSVFSALGPQKWRNQKTTAEAAARRNSFCGIERMPYKEACDRNSPEPILELNRRPQDRARKRASALP